MSIDSLSQFDEQLVDGLEFCSRVYALFESVRTADDGPTRLRTRPSILEKRLLEELLPICRYIQVKYRAGRYISVKWVNGSQTYDAELFQSGALVTQDFYPPKAHLEVTCAMHPKEYLRREMLEKHGYTHGLDGLQRTPDGDVASEPIVHSGMEFVRPFADIILDRIRKKESLSYPDPTYLVIDCILNYPYIPNEWDELMSIVRSELPTCSFREIFMYDNVGQYFETIFPTGV